MAEVEQAGGGNNVLNPADEIEIVNKALVKHKVPKETPRFWFRRSAADAGFASAWFSRVVGYN
jgi:hypothetical protein